MPEHESTRYDAIVIGTGFGGAVTAARLVQVGLRILVLERGMRYGKDDFPVLPRGDQVLPDAARYAWSSREGRLGLWDVRDMGGLFSVQAAGYGGGSLIYANVQLRAPAEVFEDWPECYRGNALDRYYQLASSMLNARPITRSALFPLRKTAGLHAAARQLRREDQLFDPPLAVNFDGHNAFGREQHACVGCGECDSGCRFGAKNSLDYNYLAVVEDATRDGSKLASIRTLCEANAIERLPEAEGGGYRVGFLDHLVLEKHLPKAGRFDVLGRAARSAAFDANDEVEGPKQRSALARWVFVCAGAAGSTELLFRSRSALHIPSTRLGKRFYTNSDALGIVFDTKHEQEPSVGPVITKGLVFRGSDRAAPWFLVQDGGYGAPVHALVRAVFRSPGLLRRNRYRDPPGNGVAPTGLDARGTLGARPYKPPCLPLRDNASIFEGLYHAEMAHQLEELIPKQAGKAALQLVGEAKAFQVAQIGDLIERMKPNALEKATAHWARVLLGDSEHPCAEWLRGCLRPVFGLLIRVGFRGLQLLLGPETSLPQLATATFEEQFALQDQRKAFVELLRWLARYDTAPASEERAEHSAALLTMGRDLQGHAVTWNEQEEQLEATPIARESLELASMQECALRELASALGGELRVNPLWSQGRTPVTVHAQGGCAMGEDQESVTDPNGQVRGCEGLYVMDGSSFPSPVGVNPSATILAVAERNVEKFIRAHVAGQAQWSAVAPGNQDGPPDDLAPEVIQNRRPTRAPEPKPIGLTFKERLYGFHAEVASPPLEHYSAFENAYLAGRRAGRSMELTIEVIIPDLQAFLEDPTGHSAKAQGALVLGGPTAPDGLAAGRYEVSGAVDLLRETTDPDQRLFVYDFGVSTPGGEASYDLHGHKRIRDDPGKDEWRDTTALFCTLKSRSSGARSAGVVRVSLDRFLFEELPSFHVTGLGDDPDPARVLWALASFGEFFFGNLWQVYMREARWAQRLLARSMQLGAP